MQETLLPVTQMSQLHVSRSTQNADAHAFESMWEETHVLIRTALVTRHACVLGR